MDYQKDDIPTPVRNSKKEPRLVQGYLDNRDLETGPCYHIDSKTQERERCWGKCCPVCRSKQGRNL